MPLETATYVSDLNASAPAHSDGLNQADAHMRLIKAALKSTFAHTGTLTNADNQLIPAAGTLPKPAYSFAAEPTLGFYRSAAGTMRVAGGKLANAVPTGMLCIFPKEPPSLAKATADVGKDYAELNGATYNRADYPDLADFYNGVGVGTTFTVDNMYDTGRFPRSRSAAIAARSAQSNTVGPHTHPDVQPTTAAETQEHTHSFSGTTGSMNRSNPHSHPMTAPTANSSTGGGAFTISSALAATNTGATDINHEHAFSGTTSGRSAAHNHTVLVSTPANTGTTETRPEARAFVFAVKT